MTYEVTSRFPRSELFGVTSQLRRSVMSIGANLAEGAGRGSDAELRRYIRIATGSAFEYEAHVTLAQDVGLLESTDAQTLLAEIAAIKRMLHGLVRSLR